MLLIRDHIEKSKKIYLYIFSFITMQRLNHLFTSYQFIKYAEQKTEKFKWICLEKKQLETNTYCPPILIQQVTKNIPFSLSLRIVRTCTNTMNRDNRISELKDMLLHRSQPERLIDSAIQRAIKIPRKMAFNFFSSKNVKKRPVFVFKFDPSLPAIASIQAKHWR